MNEPILYINACVRRNSRTKRLADELLTGLAKPYEELCLNELTLPTVDESFLNKRDELISLRDFGNPLFDLARRFSEAEEIVIAAPYWDLSFPASLKQYLEQVNVSGISFEYTSEGIPHGLCRAERLFYVTTAGGEFVPEDYGFGYVKALAENYYGIKDVRLVKAVGLDIDGADVEEIMRKAEEGLSDIAGAPSERKGI